MQKSQSQYETGFFKVFYGEGRDRTVDLEVLLDFYRNLTASR